MTKQQIAERWPTDLNDPFPSQLRQEFEAALEAGRPYFGRYMFARGWWPERHRYMTALVRDEIRTLERDSFQILEAGTNVTARGA